MRWHWMLLLRHLIVIQVNWCCYLFSQFYELTLRVFREFKHFVTLSANILPQCYLHCNAYSPCTDLKQIAWKLRCKAVRLNGMHWYDHEVDIFDEKHNHIDRMKISVHRCAWRFHVGFMSVQTILWNKRLTAWSTQFQNWHFWHLGLKCRVLLSVTGRTTVLRDICSDLWTKSWKRQKTIWFVSKSCIPNR